MYNASILHTRQPRVPDFWFKYDKSTPCESCNGSIVKKIWIEIVKDRMFDAEYYIRKSMHEYLPHNADIDNIEVDKCTTGSFNIIKFRHMNDEYEKRQKFC